MSLQRAKQTCIACMCVPLAPPQNQLVLLRVSKALEEGRCVGRWKVCEDGCVGEKKVEDKFRPSWHIAQAHAKETLCKHKLSGSQPGQQARTLMRTHKHTHNTPLLQGPFHQQADGLMDGQRFIPGTAEGHQSVLVVNSNAGSVSHVSRPDALQLLETHTHTKTQSMNWRDHIHILNEPE